MRTSSARQHNAAHGGGFDLVEQNRLLTGLPAGEWTRLDESLELVSLASEDVIFEPDSPIEHVYFPTRGVLSLIAQGRCRRYDRSRHDRQRRDGWFGGTS